MNRAQAIIAVLRGEVDRIEVGREQLLILGEHREQRRSAAECLRAQADQRHPELMAARALRKRAMREGYRPSGLPDDWLGRRDERKMRECGIPWPGETGT